MKKIEDYLPLYLGCECQFNGETAILHSASIWKEGQAVFINNEVQPCDLHIHDLKLILRELSSMTEEEAIELAKLSEWEPHFRDVEVTRNKYSNDIVVTWQGSNESREQFNATGDLFYCAEQFQWLLAKGFDLFELIYYGLAISAPNPINEHS